MVELAAINAEAVRCAVSWRLLQRSQDALSDWHTWTLLMLQIRKWRLISESTYFFFSSPGWSCCPRRRSFRCNAAEVHGTRSSCARASGHVRRHWATGWHVCLVAGQQAPHQRWIWPLKATVVKQCSGQLSGQRHCCSGQLSTSNDAKHQQATSLTDDTVSDDCRSWTSFLKVERTATIVHAHMSEDRLEVLVMLYAHGKNWTPSVVKVI